MFEYVSARETLRSRLREPAPGRIQLLVGPRQVGKTTLLTELARDWGDRAVLVSADAPMSAVPGAWEAIWKQADQVARGRRGAALFLDEIQALPRWSARLKAEWDRIRRETAPLHIVASGSSSLRLGEGARETMAGRFERIVLAHWPPGAYAEAFGVDPMEAAELHVRRGSYPGAADLLRDPVRWGLYVREAILEPALARDLLAMRPVRNPALLRGVLGVALSMPAQVVSIQKIRAALEGAGASETIDDYLHLLGEAFLVAALPKFSNRPLVRRASPPKLVPLSNALLAAADPSGPPDRARDPGRFGRWVENACLARAVNAGQTVRYWREEPLEVDGVIEGSWGRLAVEVKTGVLRPADLPGLLEFVRRNPGFRPLVVTEPENLRAARAAGADAIDWRRFLLSGPPG